jgi:hypothetical protein
MRGAPKLQVLRKKLCEDQCRRLKRRQDLIEDSGLKVKSGENEWKNNMSFVPYITLVPEYQEQW